MVFRKQVVYPDERTCRKINLLNFFFMFYNPYFGIPALSINVLLRLVLSTMQ